MASSLRKLRYPRIFLIFLFSNHLAKLLKDQGVTFTSRDVLALTRSRMRKVEHHFIYEDQTQVLQNSNSRDEEPAPSQSATIKVDSSQETSRANNGGPDDVLKHKAVSLHSVNLQALLHTNRETFVREQQNDATLNML